MGHADRTAPANGDLLDRQVGFRLSICRRCVARHFFPFAALRACFVLMLLF